jgi:hypothetical protein
MSATALDISRALTIDGWMEPAHLEWLAEQASRHRRIVEVGSYQGRSTRVLADNTDGVVYALDNWKGPWEADISTELRGQLFSIFQENLKDHIASGKVIPIRCDHAFAPRGIRPDMVFIDGDHSYWSVHRDVTFWKSEIVPGGLMSGDDWDCLQIRHVVRELLGEPEVTRAIWSVQL